MFIQPIVYFFRNMGSTFAVIFSTYIPVLKYYSLQITLFKCPLTVSKCPLSILKRCPSYKEFSYSKMTEKRLGPTQDVRLKEVSVKRELTAIRKINNDLFLYLPVYIPGTIL